MAAIITLDSAADGQLAIQEGAEIIKLSDGQLSYRTTGAGADAIVSYNTMSTPKADNINYVYRMVRMCG